MAKGVTVQMSKRERAQFNQQIKAFSKLMRVTQDEALDAVAIKIQKLAKENITNNGSIDEGTTRASIDISTPERGTRRIGGNTGYSFYIEFGRKPGKMPPPSKLEGWVKRNFKVSAEDAKRIAFIVAVKIGKNGIKPRPFLRPAFAQAKELLLKALTDKMNSNAKSKK